VWQYVPETAGSPASAGDLARVLRDLHSRSLPPSLPETLTDPLANVATALKSASPDAMPRRDRDWLADQIGELKVLRPVGQDQVAAGRERVPQRGHDPGRVLLVPDEVEDRHEKQGDGPGEVDQLAQPGVGQDGGGVAQVSENDAGGAGAGQQRVRVDVDDRVTRYVNTGKGSWARRASPMG
jgi:hypothetical protein